MVSGKSRGSVINTRSFGGQCRSAFSDVHKNIYRLPLSTIQYNFLVSRRIRALVGTMVALVVGVCPAIGGLLPVHFQLCLPPVVMP